MEITNKLKSGDVVTIETHFGVPGHFIRADTRNKCSEDLVAMIQEISRILCPDDDFDIYLLPPEKGSYRDIVRFVKKHKIGSSVGAAVAVGSVALGYLNYKDSHEVHLNDKKMWVIDETVKCVELQKILADLKDDYEIKNIPEERISEVCGNLNLKKKKNSFFNVLQNDSMVEENETILKNEKNEEVFSKKISRTDFVKYIEPIHDTKYLEKDKEGVIELISPVMKQKREGKGIAWRGTYYGEHILFKNITILNNGEDIEFYMQDPDFKNQISTKERTFAVQDNMKAVFDISGELKGGELLNRSIYIKKVEKYNEETIPHKVRLTQKNSNPSDDQSSLFG